MGRWSGIAISLLISCSWAQAWAQETISGLITQKNNQPFLITIDRQQHKITSSNRDVLNNLLKLKTADAIEGSGRFAANGDVVLDSIDFVGLRRLLGAWKSPSVVLDFKSYARVSLYSTRPIEMSHGELKYTISPTQSRDWRIFFTDSSKVVLASLMLYTDQNATLTFFDSETGRPTNSLLLVKIPPP